MTMGDTNPAICPAKLINPAPAPMSELGSSCIGRDQNGPYMAGRKKPTPTRHAIAAAGLFAKASNVRKVAFPARQTMITVRRFAIRSAAYPAPNIPMMPTANGRDANRPVFSREKDRPEYRYEGTQETNPHHVMSHVPH